MTIADVQAIAPGAEILELRLGVPYIITVHSQMPVEHLQQLNMALKLKGISAIVILGVDIKVYDMGGPVERTWCPDCGSQYNVLCPTCVNETMRSENGR